MGGIDHTNAIHYAYQHAADDQTRRLLLLQNAAFLPMFREGMRSRGHVKDITIHDIQPDMIERKEQLQPGEIFETLGTQPGLAPSMVKAYLDRSGNARELIQAAQVLVFLKGNDAHDYKFSSAVLEDYYHISPAWRDTYLSANVMKLQNANASDNDLVERTRVALKG